MTAMTTMTMPMMMALAMVMMMTMVMLMMMTMTMMMMMTMMIRRILIASSLSVFPLTASHQTMVIRRSRIASAKAGVFRSELEIKRRSQIAFAKAHAHRLSQSRHYERCRGQGPATGGSATASLRRGRPPKDDPATEALG